ncbi:MAG: ATPase, partial [candidate division NC10 bacterium]|nr:ATPase [candidate division NC10 bacterium]
MRPFDLWPRLRSWLLSFSVRVKIMGIALGVILLLGLVVTFQVRATLKATLKEELRRRGGSVARDIAGRAADLILTDNLFALNELVREAMETDHDVRYVFVVDQAKNLLVHTFGQHFPAGLLEANAVLPGERFKIEILETEEGLIHDVAAPILEGRVGTVRVGMS